MLRSRRARRRRRRFLGTVTVLLIGSAAAGWYFWPQVEPPTQTANVLAEVDGGAELVANVEIPVISSDDDEVLLPEVNGTPVKPIVSEDPPATEATATADTADNAPNADSDKTTTEAQNPAVAAALRDYGAGRVIEARHKLNALLQRGTLGSDEPEVRRLLTTIAEETVFARARQPNDPLVADYVIEPGDVLIRIGRRFDVPAEIIMRINNISDPTRIRVGDHLKVPKGPFHARIDKSEFRLDVYLQDLYVRSFRVGLGADQGTPTGVWKVKNRLKNPTYYPSASAEEKRIIHADDPENPLGEHWVGLEGLQGDAVGQTGFGIHGTIEPESIGKAVSLGCVRMHNEDVALLYAMMTPGESKVTIVP